MIIHTLFRRPTRAQQPFPAHGNATRTCAAACTPRTRFLATSLSATLLLAACGGDGGGSSSGGSSGTSDNASTMSSVRSVADNRLVLPPDDGLAADSPEFQRLYGPGVFNINALANTIVGVYRGSERTLSNRFMATVNGPLDHARFLLVTGKGYSSGTGGILRVSVHPDDGSDRNLPDMNTVLASTTVRPDAGSRGGNNGFAQVARFAEKPTLQAGKLYHIVFENIDPNPAANFISVNHAATIDANGRPARWLNSRDWSTEYASRPASTQTPRAWKNLTREGSNNGVSTNHFSPIMELGYADGQAQGVGDMESGSVVPGRVHTLNAQQAVRERFTPGSDRNISGISVAAATPTGGALGWRLMHGSTELAAGQFEQPTPDYRVMQMKRDADGHADKDVHVTSMQWHDLALPTNITLKAGQQYDLVFQPAGNSQWVLAPHRNGQYYGFKWPAAFAESHAQHQVDGKWINTFLWNQKRAASPEDGHNWPVVLHLAP